MTLMSAPNLMDTARKQAEQWIARLMAPDCSRAEREDFQRWREQSPLHAQAFVATQDLLGRVDALARHDPRLQALLDRARRPTTARASKHWLRFESYRFNWPHGLPLAAGLATLALGAGFALHHYRTPDAPATLYTTQAETQRLTLPDGTIVQLDVHTRLLANVDSRARSAEVQSGRVLFEVTHDAARPFTVRAGTGTITDVGTRFQVDQSHDRTIVTLAAGAVSIASPAGGGAKAQVVELVPGQQLTYVSDSPLWVKTSVDADAVTSWSHGRLIFRGAPLAQVLDEVNRYTTHKLKVDDPTIATLPVNGNFVLGDSEAVAAALSAVLPVRAQHDGDALILSKRQ